jgi:hypothetical protein
MEAARITFAVPDDPGLLQRLSAALAAEDPPVTVARGRTAVLAFECATWDTMLRSRVIQAFEEAIGPDWQCIVQTVDA